MSPVENSKGYNSAVSLVVLTYTFPCTLLIDQLWNILKWGSYYFNTATKHCATYTVRASLSEISQANCHFLFSFLCPGGWFYGCCQQQLLHVVKDSKWFQSDVILGTDKAASAKDG